MELIVLGIDLRRDLELGLGGVVFILILALLMSFSFFPDVVDSCFLTVLAEFARCMALLKLSQCVDKQARSRTSNEYT